MRVIPPTSARSTRLLGLLTPIVIMVGVVVLLLLPNLMMRTEPGPVGSSVPLQDHPAASQRAAAAMASAVVR